MIHFFLIRLNSFRYFYSEHQYLVFYYFLQCTSCSNNSAHFDAFTSRFGLSMIGSNTHIISCNVSLSCVTIAVSSAKLWTGKGFHIFSFSIFWFTRAIEEAFRTAKRSGKIFYVGAIEESYTSHKVPAVGLLNREQLERHEDVLEATLPARNVIMVILFAKEILEVGSEFLKSWIEWNVLWKKNKFLFPKSNHLWWSR